MFDKFSMYYFYIHKLFHKIISDNLKSDFENANNCYCQKLLYFDINEFNLLFLRENLPNSIYLFTYACNVSVKSLFFSSFIDKK